MLALGHVLIGLSQVLFGLLWAYQWVLIIRAVLSWVNPDPHNPIVRFLYAVTEPPVRWIRRRLPSNLRYFPIDIAFLVLFALVIFGLYGIVPMLAEYGEVLRAQARRPVI